MNVATLTYSNPLTPSSLIVPTLTSSRFSVITKVFNSPTFLFLQGIFFALYGLKEILWDGLCQDHHISRDAPNHLFLTIKKIFPIIHGALFCLTGEAGAIASWLYFNSSRNPLISPLRGLEIGSFLVACFTALLFHIKSLQEARTSIEQNSAILGILSNLHYLLWGFFTLTGGFFSLAVACCCIGLFTGCIKILYDLKYN